MSTKVRKPGITFTPEPAVAAITFTVSAGQRERIRDAARHLGLSVSAFMRMAAEVAATYARTAEHGNDDGTP